MPARTIIKVFLGSPGDLADERKVAREVVDEFNDNWAEHFGYEIELVGWEDMEGGAGRPQSIINQQLDECDLFYGMVWKRWGMAPSKSGLYTSGFEEEFRRAQKRHSKTDKPELRLAFKTIDPEFLKDPGAQLQKVIEFRNSVTAEQNLFYKEFNDVSGFRITFNRTISVYVQQRVGHEREALRKVGLDAETVQKQVADAFDNLGLAGLQSDIAHERGVDPTILMPLFEHLGQHGLAPEQIRDRAAAAIEELIALSRRDVASSNEGHDIDATLGAARQKLAGLDTRGAVSVLADKIAEEEETRRRRLVPLLAEKATIERISYDYESAKTTLNQLLAVDADAVWHWIELGDLFVTTGSLAKAQKAFSSAVEAARHSGDERGLSFSYDRVGDVQVAHGHLDRALKSYRDSLAIRERPAQSDPGNPEGQRDLSVSFDRVGDVQMARGDLGGALKSYRDSLAIAERLAKSDPENAGWQRDLSVSFTKVGDAQVARSDLAGALKSYREGLAIRQRLAESDPSKTASQRDLSSSLVRVGDVQVSQADLAGALKSYRDSLEIIERLAKSDPGNTGWQRDLSIALDRVGDVQASQGDLAGALKSYRDSLEIIERLAESDPSNAGWQRDLSVSFERVGNVQWEQGDLSAAHKSYQDDLTARKRLVESDPDNAGWQRDLSVSLEKLGKVQLEQGDLASALTSNRESFAIRERLAKSDSDNAGWQHDLCMSYANLAIVIEKRGDLQDALASFEKGRAILASLTKLPLANAKWQLDLTKFDKAIARVECKLHKDNAS
jgi:tetratricopeptide (TPR) repeat protein